MLGRHAEALLAYQSAVRLAEVLWPDEPRTLTMMTNTSSQLLAVGRFDEALRLVRLAETRGLAAQGRGVDVRDNLASSAYMEGAILSKLGRIEEALTSYRLSTARYVDVQGARCMKVALTSTYAGSMLVRLRDCAGAQVQFGAAESIFTERGWKDREGADLLNGLAAMTA